MSAAKERPAGSVAGDESDIQQRIGSSPRLVAAISVYVDKKGNYNVNLADHVKRVVTKNPKQVLDAVAKFLSTEMEKDQFEGDEEE